MPPTFPFTSISSVKDYDGFSEKLKCIKDAEWTYIWIDDKQEPPIDTSLLFNDVIICHSYKKAITALNNYFDSIDDSKATILNLDYDLGSKKTGYDIAKYIVEKRWPVDIVHCHSINPAGKENIDNLFSEAGYRLA